MADLSGQVVAAIAHTLHRNTFFFCPYLIFFGESYFESKNQDKKRNPVTENGTELLLAFFGMPAERTQKSP